MTERRLYAPELPAEGGEVALGSDVAKHARLVLRLGVGDAVVLFDGAGFEARGTVAAADRDTLRCTVRPRELAAAEALEIHLIQGMPKGGKIDDIVRMCTELGVAAIHLADTERSVPDLGERAAKRVERLEKIAREAARQCGRARVPVIHAPAPLLEIARRAAADDIKVLFWEETRGDAAVQKARAGEQVRVWVVIGPEGGISAAEAEALVREGFVLSGLGPTVLRVETAAPVGVALVRDRLVR